MKSWLQGLSLLVLAAFVANGGASVALAQAEKTAPAPLDRKAEDEHVFKVLREVINHGADMYNNGDKAGCYHLYEGALIALKPLLDHRPQMQKVIDTNLADAERMPNFADRAFKLREAIDKIRADIHPKKADATAKGTTPPPPPAAGGSGGKLWDRLGGEKAVKKVVDDFVELAATDPKVDFDRGGKYKLDPASVAKLKTLLVEMISSVSGGPLKYTGRSMKEAHAGMGITDAEFDALAADMKRALEANGAKAAETKELLDIVGGTRKDIVEGKKPETKPESKPEAKKSLWDRLGGEPAVKKVVDDFVTLVAVDKDANFDRSGKVKLDDKKIADLKKSLVDMISSVTGGPLEYKGKSMKEAHKGMGITEAEFDAAAKDLRKALELNNVKEEEIKELLAIIAGTKKDIVEPANATNK